ncbi:MAG: hypothetical protein ABIF10_01030 [Candidatus Woesearchaeota archaeon]
MRKLSVIAIGMLLIATAALAVKPGSIWTTNGDCGNTSQDENHYNLGDQVYINGANFANTSHFWKIEGQPGGASCDPGKQVANGTRGVDSTGAFCFLAYTIASDDCGEYKADFGDKKDNYRIENPIPEFSTIAALVALAGAVVAFVAVRK